MSLAALAMELGVHVRTLQAAARTGRLRAHLSVRSVFGRPMRCASRGQQFLARHYRCFSGQEICPAPLPTVLNDYHKRLRDVRSRSGLSQDALARRIGAAVVYQWESRKRGVRRHAGVGQDVLLAVGGHQQHAIRPRDASSWADNGPLSPRCATRTPPLSIT